jgi:hypothetical protein
MRTLILSLSIVICTSLVFGQAGVIGLYVDPPVYIDCTFMDYGPALVPIYVVHKWNPGATASRWMIQPRDGWNCIYINEVVHMSASTGATMTGISLEYGGCYPSDILLTTVNFFCQGVSPPCASLWIVPDPAAPSGAIEVVGCDFVTRSGAGYGLSVNDYICWFCGYPVNAPSWGQIKALYQ